MTAEDRSWPAALAGSSAVSVIERAIERGRLSHSLLLHGDDPETLSGMAYAIADRLLNPPGSRSAFAPERHPDCFALRPAGKLRLIPADAVRQLIAQVQVSSGVAAHKVAVIHEADRMNTAAANIFLKTLEEPPAHTTLLLLTARPYALLPTIRSRVLQFRFPGAFAPVSAEGWALWLGDYRAWLGRLVEGIAGPRAVADGVMSVYGLVARFGLVLEKATSSALELQKESAPPGLDEDVMAALETGLANGLRSRLLAEIEQATRAFAVSRIGQGGEAARLAFPGAIDRLERVAGLLRVNLNESAALEDFLLASLRLWSRR